MHGDATDSSGVRRGPTPAADPGHAAPGSADGLRAADGPGGDWRGPAAVAALAALALCCLVPGWGPAAGAGPGALLLRLSLYLSGAAAALLLGTLIALVCWSPRARPPDFASSWSRPAAAVRCPLRVSTGLGSVSCPRPRARADPRGGGGPGVALPQLKPAEDWAVRAWPRAGCLLIPHPPILRHSPERSRRVSEVGMQLVSAEKNRVHSTHRTQASHSAPVIMFGSSIRGSAAEITL